MGRKCRKTTEIEEREVVPGNKFARKVTYLKISQLEIIEESKIVRRWRNVTRGGTRRLFSQPVLVGQIILFHLKYLRSSLGGKGEKEKLLEINT